VGQWSVWRLVGSAHRVFSPSRALHAIRSRYSCPYKIDCFSHYLLTLIAISVQLPACVCVRVGGYVCVSVATIVAARGMRMLAFLLLAEV